MWCNSLIILHRRMYLKQKFSAIKIHVKIGDYAFFYHYFCVNTVVDCHNLVIYICVRTNNCVWAITSLAWACELYVECKFWSVPFMQILCCCGHYLCCKIWTPSTFRLIKWLISHHLKNISVIFIPKFLPLIFVTKIGGGGSSRNL